MRQTTIFLLIAILYILDIQAAYSQERPVITKASSQLIEALLKNLDSGYEEIRNNTYTFKVKDKYKVILINNEDDIQVVAMFSGGRVSASRINEWNRTKRFTNAYLDKDDDPVIQADLDFEGGVTGESILRFIAMFAQSVEIFAEHIK